MFLRLLYESFRRQKRRKFLAGVAIMLGVGVATAMIAVATDIGDEISRELRTYGGAGPDAVSAVLRRIVRRERESRSVAV